MGKTIQVYGFPHNISAEEVTTHLERHTGHGTIYALEVKQPRNGGTKSYARVQFTTSKSAADVISLTAMKQLWHGTYYLKAKELEFNLGTYYLKAKELEFNLVPNPKVYAHSMNGANLHFGCQVSANKFSVLWEKEDVSVKFGFGLRRLYFFFPHLGKEYKLELLYENIWQIELHRPLRIPLKYLVIQLYGAPRIYYQTEVLISSYYKELPDDQWVRTTDFTSNVYIGQSSHLCLELSSNVKLPKLKENFPYYTKSETPFSLEHALSFSKNSELVPVVGPPQGFNLPHDIVFKVCALVQNGCIPGPAIKDNFFRLVDPRSIPIVYIEHVLKKLYHSKSCCYEPTTWLTEQYKVLLSSKKGPPKSPSIVLDDGLVNIRRVQVTPCRVYFCGPEVNMSNRVLRHYSADIDNFLRVSFLDEELGKMFSTDLLPRSATAGQETGIYKRILSVLRNGIHIGEKKFEFLAFSSSQLRENSAWMFASRPGLSAADIRRWMGDFRQIKNVAKYAARLGQSFSSSTESLSVPYYDVEKIPDIEVRREGTTYTFSDGIGKISSDFAKRVAAKCGFKTTPSAFQIRYGGYKGVVAVDPTSNCKLSLRKSMCKYESDNTKLDVLSSSKYQPAYLNRQLISLLSTLGVPDRVFEVKQKEAVAILDTILVDPLKAQDALDLMAPGENTNILKELLSCGYKPDGEPFLSMMLQVFRASKLLELRTKTRIFIPKGRSMMGCLDETRTLEYGQVFVQFSGSGTRQYCANSLLLSNMIGSNQCTITVGKVVVAKNPCLHPGDVRVLTAVNVPALHHMVDCVVFPQQGRRPHPNECSGSDLDGDIYFVCWDTDLIPPQQDPPMDYTPAPSKELDHDVTIEEVEQYFTDYIVNDSLGIIANAHTVFADKEPARARSEPCLELAKLFSVAVDFPKTGVPAVINPKLRVKEYPDFMEKADKSTYESKSVIGKLFREVKDISPNQSSIRSFTREVAYRSYDTDMEAEGYEYYLDEAFDFKTLYDYKLGNLMEYYGIKSEAEILSGSIMTMSKSFDRRKDAEAVGFAVRSLRKEVRVWFKELESDSGFNDVYAKASACYHVTYHPSYWGKYNEGMNREHFLSFPWCVYDKLVQIKKDKASIRTSLRMSSVERQFASGLNLI
jgi:RNA-dependent RNA polymerase